MKPPDIIDVTTRFVKMFENLDIAYHIGGSPASSAFGIAHATLEVELSVSKLLKKAIDEAGIC